MGGFFKVFRPAFKIMEDFDSPCRIASSWLTIGGGLPRQTSGGPGYFYQPIYPFGQSKSTKVLVDLQEVVFPYFPKTSQI